MADALNLLLDIIGVAVRDLTEADSLAVRDVRFAVENEVKHHNISVTVPDPKEK